MDWFNSPQFRSRALELMQRHHVPGLAIAVLQDGQTVSLALGHASLDPPRECTPDTLFDIASASKSFTGVAVALLADDDRYPDVRWDAPVSAMLPDFVLPDEYHTRNVTLDDILSHRSGMPRHDLSYLGPRAEHPDDARSVTRSLRHLPLAAPLRTKHIYTNIMFTVAAHLVAEQTGRPFADFLDDAILQPLGMTSTSVQPSRARARGFAHRMATGYCWDKKARTYRATEMPECREGEGAGSVVTSANDLVRWARGLVRRDEGPVTDAVFRELVRHRAFCNPRARGLRPWTSPAFYGAGVETYYYRGRAVVTHDGAIDGFASRFALLPDAGFAVVVCGNADGAAAVSGVLTRELIDEFLRIPPEQRSYRVRTNKKPASGADDDDGHGSSGESEGEDVKEEEEKEEEEDPAKDTKDRVGSVVDLHRYTGRFHHPGYHDLVVQVRDGRLFVDASDRSFPFTLEFEQRSATRFRVLLRETMGLEERLAGEFELANGAAVRMGLGLEPALKALLWFERQET